VCDMEFYSLNSLMSIVRMQPENVGRTKISVFQLLYLEHEGLRTIRQIDKQSENKTIPTTADNLSVTG